MFSCVLNSKFLTEEVNEVTDEKSENENVWTRYQYFSKISCRKIFIKIPGSQKCIFITLCSEDPLSYNNIQNIIFNMVTYNFTRVLEFSLSLLRYDDTCFSLTKNLSYQISLLVIFYNVLAVKGNSPWFHDKFLYCVIARFPCIQDKIPINYF